MQGLFEVAAGSIAGTDHLRIGKNNQDAYEWVSYENVTIAVVCDGCGSGANSEVGAKIGARLVVETLIKALSDRTSEVLLQVWQDLRLQLKDLAVAMGGKLGQTVNDYFLFTIVGALVTPAGLSTFSIGDGAIIVNGKTMQLGPFPDNAPPYLGYSLLTSSSEDWQFQIHQQLPLDEVESILIGTDGVSDLIKNCNCQLPGKKDLVGDLSQFWRSDRYFTNPDLIRRRLSLINQEAIKPDWQQQHLIKTSGLLPDDTTLVVIRRKK